MYLIHLASFLEQFGCRRDSFILIEDGQLALFFHLKLYIRFCTYQYTSKKISALNPTQPIPYLLAVAAYALDSNACMIPHCPIPE